MNDDTIQTKNAQQASAADAEDALFGKFHGKLGQDALRYLPAIVIPALLGVVGVAIFTRIFPPQPYGQFMVVVAVATILVPVFGESLKQSVIRYLPRYSGDDGGGEFLLKLNTMLWAVGALVIAAAAIAYPLLKPFFSAHGRFYVPTTTLVLVWLFFMVYSAVFQARLQSAKYARYQVAFSSGRLVFSLALVFFVSRDVLSLVFGMVAAYAVLIFPMMQDLGLFRPRGQRVWRPDREMVRTFAAYGLPVVGWITAMRLLDLSDRFIIAVFRGVDEVGIYAANYNLTIVVMSCVAQPLLLAADALVMNAWERGVRNRIQEVITGFTRYFLLAGVPAATFLGIFAHRFAGIVFGEAFREGYVVIPLVAAGIVVWHFGMYGQKGIKVAEKTGFIFLIMAICAAINISLNLIFVPTYGYIGAAVTTLVSYALYPIMVFRISKRHVAWVIPWRSVGKIIAAAAAAGGVWLAFDRLLGDRMFVGVLLPVGALTGGVVYALMLSLLREPTDRERDAVRQGVQRIVAGIFRRN